MAARNPKDDLFGGLRTWKEIFAFWAKRDDFEQARALIAIDRHTT